MIHHIKGEIRVFFILLEVGLLFLVNKDLINSHRNSFVEMVSTKVEYDNNLFL